MNHLFVTLPFIVFATAVLVLLAKSDERRKRFYQRAHKQNNRLTLPSIIRRLLVASLFIPFIFFITTENFAGFLCYMGALTVLGWLVSEAPQKWV